MDYNTWRFFCPPAALFARAEAAAGIFPRSRLAGGQNSSPILVAHPTVRSVRSLHTPTGRWRNQSSAESLSREPERGATHALWL